jgi:hypothetical protein
MMPTKPSRSPNSDFPKKIGWIIMTLLALLLFLFASNYLTLNPEVYFEKQKAIYIAHTVGIFSHIIGSMLAIIIGPFQFLPKSVTQRYLRLHRWMGKIYLLGVLVGGLGGLYMAFLAYGGFPARLGFATLAVSWLFSGYMAYKRIRNREIQSHRQWMVRNYALTFSAVTLRLWQVVFGFAGIEFDLAYIIVSGVGWIPNLIVAEWLVWRIRRQYNIR